MFWSTPDLSEVTEALVTVLNNAVQAWPLWKQNNGPLQYYTVSVTSSSPDNLREAQDGECQLSLYLLHVGQDPFFRNTPVLGTGAMANTQQPLSLNLTYLATAFSADNADREQQIMSIALSTFHEQPIYIGSGPDAGAYLTVSLGTDTLSEMSALWQSFACAYRLSTIYRVAVVFLTPSAAPGSVQPNPSRVGLTAAPVVDGTAGAGAPQLFQPGWQVRTAVPADGTAQDAIATVTALTAAGGGQVTVAGQGLDTIDSVTLASVDGSNFWNVTGWLTGPTQAAALVLSLPASYAIGPAAAPPPATTPPPGVYLLAVGQGAVRSAAIPFTIQPRFDNVAVPPVLHAAGGAYNFAGAGFVPGATQLFIGGVLLAAAAVVVAPDGSGVSFSLPPTQPPGVFPLRVRVDGVDAPATWQVAA